MNSRMPLVLRCMRWKTANLTEARSYWKFSRWLADTKFLEGLLPNGELSGTLPLPAPC